ncbi:hypothetical protein CCOS865_02270 [Pseudomonas reidholzensis]|uniref:Uncharacterized protein n=1 Tax=Pseudomonas reidholzensis TaxID=1785162 RepID=A0A383RTL7_9PSED|nr:hypothetical protein [Pseudomonas reidholzensis]SYX90004.1 hypothetical protein CCOS865_02270 [Pseudomonas reidholzensis]
MTVITQVDTTLWALISRLQGTELQTPYTPSNSRFGVASIDATSVTITTGAKDSAVVLTRAAFQQTLDYLTTHEHIGQAHAVVIQSSHDKEKAGPLCLAARKQPNGKSGTCVITYILPILEQCQVVGISRMAAPTTTWLLH